MRVPKPILVVFAVLWPNLAWADEILGTFGYVEMPWVAVDEPELKEGLVIKLNHPILLGKLAPAKTFVLQRELRIRKGHKISVGTFLAEAAGDPKTICEIKRRPEAKYVECFTDLDANGNFRSSYPVSLSFFQSNIAITLSYFMGRRYFDSKSPLLNKISASDFQSEMYEQPLQVYLNIYKIDNVKLEVFGKICTIDSQDSGQVLKSCGFSEKFKLSFGKFPIDFLTPFGFGRLNGVSGDSVSMSFMPSQKGPRP